MFKKSGKVKRTLVRYLDCEVPAPFFPPRWHQFPLLPFTPFPADGHARVFSVEGYYGALVWA